jgi:hypothetical protein
LLLLRCAPARVAALRRGKLLLLILLLMLRCAPTWVTTLRRGKLLLLLILLLLQLLLLLLRWTEAGDAPVRRATLWRSRCRRRPCEPARVAPLWHGKLLLLLATLRRGRRRGLR